jgi:hypothetical protein
MRATSTILALAFGLVLSTQPLSFADDRDGKPRAPAGENRAGEEAPLPASFPRRPAANVDASEEGIAREIRGLGNDDSKAREAAADRLFWCGEPARTALEGALTSKDPEVVAGARTVLALLDARKSLRPLDEPTPARGSAVVGSEKRDPEAAGGWYKSQNMPKEIPASVKAPDKTVSIVVDFESVAVWNGRTLGREVHIVNRTDAEAAFAGCDSMLKLRLEAKNETGEWVAVERPPSTDCGNSYHRAFLPAGKMWTFTAPVYGGTLKTKLRYRLLPVRQHEAGAITSEEFDGAINPGLLKAAGKEED